MTWVNLQSEIADLFSILVVPDVGGMEGFGVLITGEERNERQRERHAERVRWDREYAERKRKQRSAPRRGRGGLSSNQKAERKRRVKRMRARGMSARAIAKELGACAKEIRKMLEAS